MIQLLLSHYPGCFPEKDKRKEKSWINKEIIIEECNKVNNFKHPFYLPYINEEWTLGHICKPNNILETINIVKVEQKLYKKNRRYWAKQCCYRFDGKISKKMLQMITTYIETNQIVQI